MPLVDHYVSVDAIDEKVYMDDVSDTFVESMGHCGTLLCPDHRNDLTTVMRAIVSNHGIRTIISWYTDTVTHLTQSASR